MCYDSPRCQWFWFNPMTGTDGCRKPSHARCPGQEIIYLCECGEEIEVPCTREEHEVHCEACGKTGQGEFQES